MFFHEKAAPERAAVLWFPGRKRAQKNAAGEGRAFFLPIFLFYQIGMGSMPEMGTLYLEKNERDSWKKAILGA
jgi:hypothetical protein